MHIVVIDGRDPQAAPLVFSQALDWKTNDVIHFSYWTKTLDWSAPGFLKIEPIQRLKLPEAHLPGPLALWIPTRVILSLVQIPEDQGLPVRQEPTAAPQKMH